MLKVALAHLKTAQKEYIVQKISKYNAKTYKFDVKDKNTGETVNMSCFDYFKKKYNVIIDKWQLPLIETTKKGVLFPLELAHMCGGQRYPFKLNEQQVQLSSLFAT